MSHLTIYSTRRLIEAEDASQARQRSNHSLTHMRCCRFCIESSVDRSGVAYDAELASWHALVLRMQLRRLPSSSCNVVFDVVRTLPTSALVQLSVHAQQANACGTGANRLTI